MVKATFVLALLAAGLSGFLAWERWGCGGGTCAPTEAAPAAEAARLDALEARLASLEKRPAPIDAPSRPTVAPGGAVLAPGTAAPVGGHGAAAPATVAELEKRMAALEEYRTKAEADAARPQTLGRAMRFGRGGTFYSSIDDAKEDLKLSDPQASDWDRVLADAKRDLEDIRRIPDDEGKTWEQVQKEAISGLMDGSGKFDLSKIMSFRNKTIPGRGETYAAAESRVRDGAKAKLRDSLTPDQQTKFDKAVVDPLIGGGMGFPGATAISVITTPDAAMAGGR